MNDRLESAAWSLTGGALCAFLLSVVLKDADWRIGLTAVAVSVAGWALLSSPLVGAVLGLIGWLFVTGFDIAKDGDLAFSGMADLVRGGALIGAGLAAGAIGRLVTAARAAANADRRAGSGSRSTVPPPERAMPSETFSVPDDWHEPFSAAPPTVGDRSTPGPEDRLDGRTERPAETVPRQGSRRVGKAERGHEIHQR
ncbi:hypothetical protein ACQPZP_41480 [Spirillospora sp. CA-142024]|uniref:hypothetical protein n=1 Tax=Spirillospora sp. CA-142024 TaxID=3240036 RepID=UPI003D9237D9